jgi:peptidoglycan/LPS O-acetylase OafA/YrhL
MSVIKEDRVFFHGLNELRALAALLVFFHHIEFHKWSEGLSSIVEIKFLYSFIHHAGRNAVIAFFVLSGFLITYLLLKEKEKTGTISIKAFYIRRILRIWPLYFLTVLIGFVVMPLLYKTGLFNDQKTYTGFIKELNYYTLPLFLLFLSNIALKYFKPVAGASQSWSVSVEEQFYLVWPNIIKYTKGIKRTLLIVLSILCLKFILSALIMQVSGKGLLLEIINLISFQDMCVGAIAAILLFWNVSYEKMKNSIQSRILLAVVFAALLIELFMFNHPFILSMLFALLILLIVSQKIEIKFLNYLGTISYGIYMLHPLMIFISFSIAHQIKNQWIFNLVFYLLSLGLTIAAAGVSYKYFEAPILKFKKKHAIIQSGAE